MINKTFYILPNIFILGKIDLLGYLGLEPRTIRLKAEYSTIELATLHNILPYSYGKTLFLVWINILAI